MRVLFDAFFLNHEAQGVSKSLLYLYDWCHRIDPQFVALGFEYHGDDYMKYTDKGIVLMGNCLSTDLDDIVRLGGFDVLHFPGNYTRWRRIKGIPSLVTMHDMIPCEGSLFEHNLIQRKKNAIKMHHALRLADAVISPSYYVQSVVKKATCGTVTPEVIYWDVTLPNVQPHEGPGYPYFLYVGGYDVRKGIDVLVRAYDKLVSGGHTNAKLVVAGKPAPIDEETDRLLRAGVERGTISQTGCVSNEEICSLYANALCSLYLSRTEGFGLPLLEAMYYGCPVISSNTTCLPEIGGEGAYYVDRNNVDEVAAAMLRMQSDEECRQAHVQAGYKNLERFSWEQSAQQFLSLLERLAHAPQPDRGL